MYRLFIVLIPVLVFSSWAQSQSLEVMPGTERLFADAQWLKPITSDYSWTLFSRSRATVNYDNQTDLFTGAYLNYTTKLGVGGTVIGRIGNRGGGGDVGIHFFKQKKTWMLYALPAVEINNDLGYSWFSILRITPELNETWKLYTSLELFSAFDSKGHLGSVQRLRLGLDRKGNQFGLGYNQHQVGRDWAAGVQNPGVFIRKVF